MISYAKMSIQVPITPMPIYWLMSFTVYDQQTPSVYFKVILMIRIECNLRSCYTCKYLLFEIKPRLFQFHQWMFYFSICLPHIVHTHAHSVETMEHDVMGYEERKCLNVSMSTCRVKYSVHYTGWFQKKRQPTFGGHFEIFPGGNYFSCVHIW